jgi:hypothetical protein
MPGICRLLLIPVNTLATQAVVFETEAVHDLIGKFGVQIF